MKTGYHLLFTLNYLVNIVYHSGFGYGMIYLPSIVCVSQHFESKRALATGIGVSGAGIGTFIFSPLTSILIKTYAWQGALLIQAGLALNCFVCALVFRPVITNVVKRNHENEIEVADEDIRDNKDNVDDPCNHDTGKHRNDKLSDSASTEDTLCQKSASVEDVNVNIPTDVSRNVSEPLLYKESHTHKTSSIDEQSDEKNKSGSTLYNVWRNLLTLFDVEIFRNVAYCMFLISTFLYSVGYYIPYIYLPDTAREAGTTFVIVIKIIKYFNLTSNK